MTIDDTDTYSLTFRARADIWSEAHRYETMPVRWFYYFLDPEERKSFEEEEQRRVREWENRKPLREHLLDLFPEAEVDQYFERKERLRKESEAREKWEKSIRGRISIKCRFVKTRIRETWDVLLNGTDQFYGI